MSERPTPAVRRADCLVAYVLKGFPRLSETFVSSEIHRLEQAGLHFRLFVIKPSDEPYTHPIVDRIRAHPEYLPATSPVSGVPLWRWLRAHFGSFRASLLRTIRRRPLGVLRAAGAAWAQAFRARGGFLAPPRKVYAKEFLQAVALADRLLDAPTIRHLHAHFCHGATTVTWLAALMTGRSFSFTAHAKDLYTPELNPAGLLDRKLAAARFVVTCTESNRVFLEHRAGSTPVFRVYHGLNAEFTELMRRATAPLPEPYHAAILSVIAVGRHVRKKGFDVFVDACAEIVGRGVALHAVIAGESGSETTAIRSRIRQRGLQGHVHLAGAMSQAALLQEYRRATVFCLPCRVTDDGDRDGIPNVLVEAMASGLPVVTTAVSGIPELVEHEVSGLIVPVDDPASTADALLRIFWDRALAERVSSCARAVVQDRFDGDRLIAQLHALFQEVA